MRTWFHTKCKRKWRCGGDVWRRSLWTGKVLYENSCLRKKNLFVQITFPAKSTTAGLPGYYFQYIYIIFVLSHVHMNKVKVQSLFKSWWYPTTTNIKIVHLSQGDLELPSHPYLLETNKLPTCKIGAPGDDKNFLLKSPKRPKRIP